MGTFIHSLPPVSLGSLHPITALTFDPVSDVLWAGSNDGHVTACCGTQGIRGASFRVGDLGIVKIVSGESTVKSMSVSGAGVGAWSKGGVNRWFHESTLPLTNFACSWNSTHSLAASNSSPELLLLNAVTGKIVRQTPVPSLITHLEFSHSLLLSGSSDGFLRTHDPRTGVTRPAGEGNIVRAHSSGYQGLQTSGNYIFTIGMSLRQGRPFPDPLVKIYDLRTMRPLPPIPFSSSPAFINIIPKRPSSIAITSNQGLLNIVDVANANAANEFYQLDLASYITAVAISPTGAYIACGDAEGNIHLRSQAEDAGQLPFNGFDGQGIEWAQPAEPLPDIQWTESTPLNSIGMAHYKTQLLSAWTPQFITSTLTYPPAQKIPLQILNAMKLNDNVAYASYPKELKGRRNMVILGTRKGKGRFRSIKSRAGEAEPDTPTFDYDGEDIPKLYRATEIQYSKFGIEDFDFGFYNRTEYSGLETHILNSYTNSLLQALHYNLPVRAVAKSHITTACAREHCLLCELGFVFRSLEDARGTNCQASNFCKSVGVLAHGSNAIDLIEYGQDTRDANYSHMIQSFQRFLVEHLIVEGNAYPHNPNIVKKQSYQFNRTSFTAAPITQLFGIDAINVVTCLNCKAVRDKDNLTHIVDLIYPRYNPANEYDTFTSILRTSMLRNVSHKANCQNCGQFSVFSSRRSIATRDLPMVLAVNAGVFTDDAMKFWVNNGTSPFLSSRIELQGQVGGVDDPQKAIYELRATIVQVTELEEKTGKSKTHLLSIVKGTQPLEEGESPWYLFNDFAVVNVSEEEALSFPDKWKTPAILHFARVDLQSHLDLAQLPDDTDASILCRDTSISFNRDPSLVRHECLRPDELPRPGTLVAIDAEFVSMQQEEVEYRSDGNHKVIRPARMSLARVSVLRGGGPKESVPFIDDHIHTSEAIVDYLTSYSGIKYLDPMRSPYTLTPLKLVYKKLRLLVDLGCIFIGHGLSKDFRIINIFVPPDQVIDTVDLYFLKARQRRLSLRFVSWIILGENIQTDNHDSIEDARSALKLFKAYHDFEEKGTFDKQLDDLYKAGRQYNFKVPEPEQPVVDPEAQVPPENVPVPFVPFNLEQANMLMQMYPSSQSGTPVPNGMANRFGHPRGHAAGRIRSSNPRRVRNIDDAENGRRW